MGKRDYKHIKPPACTRADEHMYELMKAQAFIINRQRQEAKWILDDFKHSNPDKKAPIWGYYLYLMTLLEREPSYVDNMTHEVELIFMKILTLCFCSGYFYF